MTQEQLFRITIDEFNFSNRLYEYLTEKEIHTLGDLKDKTACDLGLSPKSPSVEAKEFAMQLGKWGIRLKEDNLKRDDVLAVMLGHAIGDAMGVPVEFRSREELAQNPVRGYLGYGTHYVPAGTWSDDTSMALAALDSLAHGLDYSDMMRRFCDWKTNAAYTATDEVYDMGIATNQALCRFLKGATPLDCGGTDENDNGNGSLMRIIPAVLYCNCMYSDTALEERMQIIHEVSSLTHAHLRSQIGCGIYAIVLSELLAAKNKSAISQALTDAKAFYQKSPEFAGELVHYSRLFQPDFAALPEREIRSSGYVVSTLEAAIWCVLNSESYAECVLKAVNLGNDTDTVAAVAGGLAAALYGLEGIPQEWVDGLLRKEMVTELCENFTNAQNAAPCLVFDEQRIAINVEWENREQACANEQQKVHRLVDVHGHYVFGVDDGARDVEMSLEMIRKAYAQGIRDIICTSHSWGYLEKYKRHFAELNARLQREKIDVRLYTGTEIACTERMLPVIVEQLENGTLLPLGTSNYILLEFEPNAESAEILRCVKQLGETTAYRPVIAHAERYRGLYTDEQSLRMLRAWGIPIQINAYSLVEEKKPEIRDFARKLLADGMVTFVGSDAHRTVHRPPNVQSGIEYIYETCGKDYADAICYRNAESLLL